MSASSPPHSLEAEESVIGGILVHARLMADAALVVRAEDFYHPALRAIYEAMVELDSSSKPIDALTVAEQMRALETFDKLRAFNGTDYLSDLMSKIVTAENIGYHARIVHTKARRRQWIDRLRSVVAAGYAGGDDEDFFTNAEHALLELSGSTVGEDDAPKTMKRVLGAYQDVLAQRAKARRETGDGVIGISSGFAGLDRVLSGLHPGQLIVIAARPSVGKTALATDILTRCAERGVLGLFFSLEMADTDIGERMVSSKGRLDSLRLRQGALDTQQWTRVTSATAHLVGLPIEVVDRGTITVTQIRSIARRWRLRHPVSADGQRPPALVVVDYLQLVTAGGGRKNGTREQDVSEISRSLKLLAKDLQCPVIALSQLNRQLEQRTDKRPNLSDLRESGAIEQDADVIAFIYRDEIYSKDQCKEEDKGVAEIIIGKQRMGPTATVRLKFKASFTRFESLSDREPP